MQTAIVEPESSAWVVAHQEKLRVAEAVEDLPVLARALADGTLHWSAVRELTRVAVRETERAWLELADGKSLRQLEELVAGKTPGDDPLSAQQPSALRHVLRFEVTTETFALFRDAMTALRRTTDGTWDDDSALLALARLALGGPRDAGRASYQIALTVCAECGRGQQLSSGDLLPVGPEIVAMAPCDSQQLGHIGSHAANDAAAMSPPDSSSAARADTSVQASSVTSHVQEHSGAIGEQHATGAHVGVRVAVLEGAHRGSPPRARAKQATPPALRRSVLLRDQRRCRVPGCRNAAFLDVHHLELRSDGGHHDASNLITLCGAHHRAAHRGKLLIEGSLPAALRFRHADGSRYGQAVEPQALEAQTKTFGALRNLGFRESAVRALLARLRDEGDLKTASVEQWLRAALARITPARP